MLSLAGSRPAEVLHDPVARDGRADEMLDQQVHFEAALVVVVLVIGQHVEEQGGEATVVQPLGDEAVPRAESAAPAPVRADDQADRVSGTVRSP